MGMRDVLSHHYFDLDAACPTVGRHAGTEAERSRKLIAQEYAQLSSTPDQFDAFSEAVGLMQSTQPNYSAADLAQIRVPVTIVHSEHDEFIKQEHAEYLARSIPDAEFIYLPDVSHFAPLQRPEQFNRTVLAFLNTVLAESSGRE